MQEKSLSQNVKEMRKLSLTLIPNTYPNVDFEEEAKILPLKCRTIIVDGYEISANFSTADYKKYSMESLQIQSVYTAFLPFNLVCKVARAFLGSEHLSYVDFMKQHKKIYCWTVKRKKDKAIPANKNSIFRTYEGFEYSIIKPGSVNLYEP